MKIQSRGVGFFCSFLNTFFLIFAYKLSSKKVFVEKPQGKILFEAKWIGRKIYLTIMSIFTDLWKKFKLQTLSDSFTDILAFL